MSLAEITITELRNISDDTSPAFKILAKSKEGILTSFTCQKIYRCLPGKRISCLGTWQNKTVFAKIFISKQRSKTHCFREQKGIELLHTKQIISPKILQVSTALNNEVHIIFFDFIDSAMSAQTVWDNSPIEEQQLFLEKMVTLIAKHHNKGVIQKDLHLDNFLIKNESIYTLDGSDITNSEVKHHKALNNLALFFAQFYPENDKYIFPLFKLYISLRNCKIEKSLIDTLLKCTQIKRDKRKNSFLKKIHRECSLFLFKKKWHQLIICNKNHLSNEMTKLLAHPDKFIEQGKFLKKGKSATISLVCLNDKKYVIKRYNTKNILHAIRKLFRTSRASLSWRNAHMLNFYGISTHKPIALIENRRKFIQKTSYYITEFIEGETCLEFYRNKKHSNQIKSDTADKIMGVIAKLHSLFITHGDLKTTNLIISNHLPTFIDLDSMQQHSKNVAFYKAKKKDINRFLKNWENDPVNSVFFKK